VSNGVINESEGTTRRDFLGLASMWAFFVAMFVGAAGSFRMLKPTVRFEAPSSFKIGKPENFPAGLVKVLDEKGVVVFSKSDGLHAISTTCTHLGCVVQVKEHGFDCPCHGSKYNDEGRVIGGPAPRPLPWYKVSMSIDGNLVVDTATEVPEGTKFMV
jgi:cytochrome b6-f complex iron-sulfur subunit